jgi:hypothetical protein
MSSRLRVTEEQKKGKQIPQGACCHSTKKVTKQRGYTVAKGK